MILELSNYLNESGNSNRGAKNHAPVVSFDDWPRAHNRSVFAFLEVFDMVADNVGNRSGIGIQNVTGGNNEFVSSIVATSPLKVRFVSRGYGVPAWSNSHGNWKVTFPRFQNQATSSFDVDNSTDADLNPAKRIGDADQVFSHFYAGFEKKDKYNPRYNEVKRERSQEGCDTVHVKVESSDHDINQNHDRSANYGSHGTVLEILHNLSLSEEQVG